MSEKKNEWADYRFCRDALFHARCMQRKNCIGNQENLSTSAGQTAAQRPEKHAATRSASADDVHSTVAERVNHHIRRGATNDLPGERRWCVKKFSIEMSPRLRGAGHAFAETPKCPVLSDIGFLRARHADWMNEHA